MQLSETTLLGIFRNNIVAVNFAMYFLPFGDIEIELQCNVSAKIWNTPELHSAQPLDYLSQYP